MYKGYKIIPIIPAGRRSTLEVLLNYFSVYKDIIDEVHLWENTQNKKDLQFMHNVSNEFIKVLPLPEPYEFKRRVQLNTGRFFEYCTDPDAIYIRFDDDMVYIDEEFLPNLLDFRIKYPEYLAVFPNIVNNAFCAYHQQGAGVFSKDLFDIEDGYCMNMQTWGNPEFGVFIHELLLEKIKQNKVSDFYFDNLILDEERFSISSFAIMGSTYAAFDGKLKGLKDLRLDEEIWLTEYYPRSMGLENAVVGNAVVSHFTFSPYQKKYIIETDILKRYKKLSRQKLSDSYYNLLDKT